MRSVPLRLYGLALLSAALQLLPFSLAGPVPSWRRLICWIGLVPLLVALSGCNTRKEPLRPFQAALLSYACGVVWFCGNCYWIYQTMFLYGGLPAPAAFGILILFSLYLGLYFALFGVCFALIRNWKGLGLATVLSPVLWVAVELARDRITGFPWDLLGYTQIDNAWLTPLAPWTGVMGLSLVVAVGNALWLWQPKLGAKRLRWVGPVFAAALVALSYAGTDAYQPPSQATNSAVLVQDNLSVGAEAHGPRESQPELLESLFARTLHPQISPAVAEGGLARVGPRGFPQPAIVLWPEAPTDFRDADPQFREVMARVALATQSPVVVDAIGRGTQPNASGNFAEFGSASFFLPDGTYAGRYDKMHLVPFGEYTPYKPLFFFAGHLLDQLGFSPGTERRLFSVEGHRFGVFICYESIFGDEVREFTLKGAQVLANLSDDGWFGDTSAPWEILDMARMRAIENHRWLLLDTNTGLTASVDPEGRIVAQMPRHVRGAVEVPFAFFNGLTVYTRFGDWIGWLCAIVMASVLLGEFLQRRYPRKTPRQTRTAAAAEAKQVN